MGHARVFICYDLLWDSVGTKRKLIKNTTQEIDLYIVHE